MLPGEAFQRGGWLSMRSPPPQNLPIWLQVACCCTCQRCVKVRGEAAGATNRDQHSRLHHACTRTVQYSTYIYLYCAVLHCCRSNAQKPKSPRAKPKHNQQRSLDPHQHPTAVTLDSPQSLSSRVADILTTPRREAVFA